MSRWPVEQPPKDQDPPSINLRGAPPDPEEFGGPLNVFIGLHGTAVANNTANQTLADYEELHPEDPLPREPPAPEPPAPEIKPVSAGTPIPFDPKKYVIDRSVQENVASHRHRPARYI